MRASTYLLNREHWIMKNSQKGLSTPDDQPLDSGEDDDDNPKPDDDSKKTLHQRQQDLQPLRELLRDEHVPVGAP